MSTTDPITNRPIPQEAIQRVLYLAPKAHVYQIPPLTSNKGYTAATWTGSPPMFSGRVRVIETAVPRKDGAESVSVNIHLEDASTGELFAACPYRSQAAVQHALDSSRFFAIRVEADGGRMKATLGLGFEDRSEAFDFGVALQDSAKVLGFADAVGANKLGGKGPRGPAASASEGIQKDYSLKEGETITVNIGGKGRRQLADTASLEPSGGPVPFLPPPPSTSDIKQQRKSNDDQTVERKPTAAELGFDDGEFGEFQ